VYNPKKELRLIGLAALSGLLLALSFPLWNVPSLAFVALIPLLLVCRDENIRSRKQLFFLGWLTGLIYFTGTLSWVAGVMHDYGYLPWSVSYAILILFMAYLAVYVGLFALCVGTLQRNLLLMAPVCFTALEYIRGHLLTGFPWNTLGYSQYRNLPLIQIADLTSVYGVSFVIVLVNTALFLMLQEFWHRHRFAKQTAMIMGAVLLSVVGYGRVRLSQPMDKGEALSVGVVQANIDQAVKWTDAVRDETIQKHERLSLLFPKKPDLVVWPEAAMPVFIQSEPIYQQRLMELTQQGDFDLLFGAPAFQVDPNNKVVLLNSAYLLRSESRNWAPDRYDKIHLVPFGEYVPLQSSLLFFVSKMVEGIGSFVPGETPTVMRVGPAQIGTLICYEVIFPELVRRFAKNGANLLVTITNDAWFGRSAAPYQHFSMVVFRAVENRVPFARAANTGISGFIDPHGRIVQQSSLLVDDVLLEALRPGIRKTVYTEHGDFFAIGCLILLAGFVISSHPVFRSPSPKRI
jgi:apolipoprotein N-acyltransferase